MWPLLLLACAAGPDVETLVDELRVLSVDLDLPEARPGETVTASTIVVDPMEEGFVQLSWPCSTLGEGCLEATGEAAWAGLETGSSPSRELEIPADLQAIASETPLPLTTLWTLACLPDLCPIFDLVEDPDPTELRAWLTSPTEWMVDLPLIGVSLASRTVLVSTRADEERLPAPTLDCALDADALATCAVSGEFDEDAALWGYTTAGGWGAANIGLAAGDVQQDYLLYPPEEGAAQLWIVLADGNGGTATWAGSWP